ncbi:MAG: iron-siderophore transporter permease, partial [Rubritepida sp.]|nr:iron-siderophore transporter permease [Rubritepida sp.]
MSAAAPRAEALRAGRRAYRAGTRRKAWILAGLGLALVLSLLLDLSIGSARYSYAEILRTLAGAEVPRAMRVVIWEIRLPGALMAVVVGAALSVAGAQMQTALNNPLASPFTLGISAAAGFGAALGLVLGVGVLPWATRFLVPANAFVMAMGAALLIQALSRRPGMGTETVVLLGIALVFTFNALLTALQ